MSQDTNTTGIVDTLLAGAKLRAQDQTVAEEAEAYLFSKQAEVLATWSEIMAQLNAEDPANPELNAHVGLYETAQRFRAEMGPGVVAYIRAIVADQDWRDGFVEIS